MCLLFILGLLTAYAFDVAPPLVAEAAPHHATIEFGETDAIINNHPPLFAHIRFPYSGNLFDQTIEYWAQKTYAAAKVEIEELRKTDSSAEGEINIHFDSYVYDERYVGIALRGFFIHSHMTHPKDIIHTFNIDLSRDAFLDNSDIIDPAHHEEVLDLLREKILDEYPNTAAFLDDMDERWLTWLTISADGITVVLESSVLFPNDLGLLTVTLPYDELGSGLALGAEKEPEPPIEEAPVLPGFIPLKKAGHIDPSKPMVALTFDDGPSQHTLHILDLLEQYEVRATFFTIGNLLDSRGDIVVRAVNLGCEIIGHSWDHRDLTRLTEDQIKRQILDTNAAVEAITGVETRMFRPPYGAVNDRLKKVSHELGFAIINWSVDPKDWRDRNADTVASAIMRNVHDRAIILSHDLYGTTAQAMERVIPELIAQGYQLVTVSELLSFQYDELEAGKVYFKGN